MEAPPVWYPLALLLLLLGTISTTMVSGNQHLAIKEHSNRINRQARNFHHDTEEDDDDDGDDNLEDVDKDHNHPALFQQKNITAVFTNKETFLCPLARGTLVTGTSLANLSPEDIDIVAAMGDSLASGRGLWSSADVEFRGASFPIGGDANIDGLVTIPNILLEFNDKLEGVSHGMGGVDQLPTHQFNVGSRDATTNHLPKQADELVRRLTTHIGKSELAKKWVLVTIAIGTEEFCAKCASPSTRDLRIALATLRKYIPKVFVVLLGPVHVASSYSQNINLLKPRCQCLGTLSKNGYRDLVREWATAFYDVQSEFNNLNYSTFGVLAIPLLTIHSRFPESLFIDNYPLLNRKGHTYAAKWLWNRLIGGPDFNATRAIFSEDSYFCPTLGCPYFRTMQNYDHCSMMTMDDFNALKTTKRPPRTTTMKPTRREGRRGPMAMIREHLTAVILVVVGIAFAVVIFLGTIFYRHGLKATKGRFESLTGV